MAAGPVYNPPVPYLGPIPGGIVPGKMIRIHGDVPYDADRFAVNLQCGPGVNPRDDIGIHINFRFPENCVVRNHLTGGVWGSEDLEGGMPLTPGQPFQILLLTEPSGFKIALNGIHFCDFGHRIPYQRLNHITVDGDVAMTYIAFEGGEGGYQSPPAYSAQQPGFNPMAPPQYGTGPGTGYIPPNASLSYAGVPPAGYGQPGAPPYGAPPMYTPPQAQTESSGGNKLLRYGLPLAGGAAAGVGAYYLADALSNRGSSEETYMSAPAPSLDVEPLPEPEPEPEDDDGDWLGDDD